MLEFVIELDHVVDIPFSNTEFGKLSYSFLFCPLVFEVFVHLVFEYGSSVASSITDDIIGEGSGPLRGGSFLHAHEGVIDLGIIVGELGAKGLVIQF